MKGKRTVKRKRIHLDDRIARAESQQEKRLLALFGRTSRTGIPAFVALWRTIRSARAAKQDISELAQALEIETRNRFVRAMVHCQPETLEEIAREMRRQEKEDEWTPDMADKLRHAMLVEGEKAEPNWSELSAKLSFGGVNCEPSSMGRIRKRWKRKDR